MKDKINLNLFYINIIYIKNFIFEIKHKTIQTGVCYQKLSNYFYVLITLCFFKNKCLIEHLEKYNLSLLKIFLNLKIKMFSNI